LITPEIFLVYLVTKQGLFVFNYKYHPLISRRLLKEGINLASEDFFYNDAVDMVDKDVLSFIFDSRDGGKKKRMTELDYTWPYPVDPEVYDGDYSQLFFVEVVVNRDVKNMSAPTNLSGGATTTDDGFNKLEIELDVAPGVNLEDEYDDIVGELRGTLAHEMHHFTQTDPFKRPDCPFLPERESDSYFHYFTSACEVPAFIIGFRATAAHKSMSVSGLIDEYLANYESIGALTPGESQEVKDLWNSFRF